MPDTKLNPKTLQRLIDTVERTSPGVSFDGLCVFVSESVVCRDARMTAGQVRMAIMEHDLRTVATRPEPTTTHNLLNRLFARPKRPFCVSYGMGVDSTAVLVWLARMYHSQSTKCPQYRPDFITFADTGNEKQETYDYLDVIQSYLKRMGFPPVVIVKYEPNPERVKHGMYYTLEQDCLVKGMLPSWAYGMKGCSAKWKLGPQDRYRAEQPAVRSAWDAGLQAIVAIGYDSSPTDSKRRWNVGNDDKYEYIYPLIDLGWDRERCIEEIRAEGLAGWETDKGGKWLKSGGVPVKSACWFCPSTKPAELVEFSKTDHGRDYLRAIIRMEDNAAPNLTDIEGLWRNGVKGTRGGEKKPGKMGDFIKDKGLLRGMIELPLLEHFEFESAQQCAGCV